MIMSRFDIDMAKCMYCGLCSEPCPTGSIHHTPEFEGADYSLESLVRRFVKDPVVAYKLKTNAYKFSWLIIPLSVPFVWLLFPFSRRFRVYDHTVFVTYSLCFMMLLVVAAMLFQAASLAGIGGLLWLIPPVHMYRQLKGTYALSRGAALWRTTLLTMFAFLVITLFAALLIGMGSFE